MRSFKYHLSASSNGVCVFVSCVGDWAPLVCVWLKRGAAGVAVDCHWHTKYYQKRYNYLSKCAFVSCVALTALRPPPASKAVPVALRCSATDTPGRGVGHGVRCARAVMAGFRLFVNAEKNGPFLP